VKAAQPAAEAVGLQEALVNPSVQPWPKQLVQLQLKMLHQVQGKPQQCEPPGREHNTIDIFAITKDEHQKAGLL
jgi:hypothetical protein